MKVKFEYRLITGETIKGEGVVINETIVGIDNAYVIESTDGTVRHVRKMNCYEA